jgi:Glycosyl transferase family group 2
MNADGNASSVETERKWAVNGMQRGRSDSFVDYAEVAASPLAPPARNPHASPVWPVSPAETVPRTADPGRRAPRHSRGGRAGRWAGQAFRAVTVTAIIAAIVWAGIELPPARYLIYAVWLLPLIELAMLGLGQLHYRWRFRVAPRGKYTQMIIQITTSGREQTRVSQIVNQVRGYNLAIPHQVWVVTEPGYANEYPMADLVITVPASFSARSERKARALEYSRRVRQSMGLSRADVKILYNDDDVALTKAYIERSFQADYDICQGIVAPRTEYGGPPLGHFLASHADDIRTHACLVYCSVFQGIIGRPLHVHGEGLAVTGETEHIITWDWPAFASEDLVFGQRAAEAGLKWGWFHEYAEGTPPWSLKDFVIQRARWLWGDIHGITHRDVLSRTAAVITALKYIVGATSLLLSLAGLYLRASGGINGQSPFFDVAKLSVVAWVTVFFACGWVGAGSRVFSRSNDSRLLSATVAVLVLPFSLLLTCAGVFIPLIQGNPRTFKVISKTRERR